MKRNNKYILIFSILVIMFLIISFSLYKKLYTFDDIPGKIFAYNSNKLLIKYTPSYNYIDLNIESNDISASYCKVSNDDTNFSKNTKIDGALCNIVITGLEKAKEYNIKIEILDDSEKVIDTANIKIKTLSSINDDIMLKAKYWENGITELYYHDSRLKSGAMDNSYRFSGKNPNNYVCIDSDTKPCPLDSLYRIIGLFDDDKNGKYQLKLIKADYANSDLLGENDYKNDKPEFNIHSYYQGEQSEVHTYYWYKESNDDWRNSKLNTEHLNKNYLEQLNNIKDYIVLPNWYLNTIDEESLSKKGTELFSDLFNVSSSDIYNESKIGLMYPTDYYYAADAKHWDKKGNSSSNSDDYRSATTDNWMYMGMHEWTITKVSNKNNSVVYINENGKISASTDNKFTYAVRPVFYIKEEIGYIDGNGSKESPYILSDYDVRNTLNILLEDDKDSGKNNLYYHDGEVDIKTETTTYTASLEDGDGNYRYSGANPNNYICFGTDNKDLCINQKDTYLYRIIGVFNDSLKIIKNTSIGNNAWSTMGNNKWAESTLKNYLNNGFLNSIPAEWQTKIMENTWNTAELTYNNVVTQTNAPQNTYNAEKASDITFDAKVGLMNLSDYYYAAKPDAWTYKGDKQSGGGFDYGDAKSLNWLAGINEYVISAENESNHNKAFIILSSGKTGSSLVNQEYEVRPVLVLYPDLLIIEGNGSAENPYIVEGTSATGSDVFDESLLANHIIKQKDNSLILHDGQEDFSGQSNVNLEAGDNAYRYAGSTSSVNNWVCFGSDNSTCPENNLYRIIGMFDDDRNGIYNVKLIKWDYASYNDLGTNGAYKGDITMAKTYYKGNISSELREYYWNFTNGTLSTNNWEVSNLNTVNLNTNFYNKFTSKWKSAIENYPWTITGATQNDLLYSNAKTAFDVEIKNNSGTATKIYYGNIGLMYVSDYYYAADSKHWNKPGLGTKISDTNTYTGAKDENWIYMGMNEFSITKSTSSTTRVLVPGGSGNMGYTDCAVGGASVRPAFYLKDTIKYKSGNGTKDNPYRIDV